MTDAHTEFLENPEGHASHLESCAECRAMFAQLNARIGEGSVRVGDLPLAPWEGAAYRSWSFVSTCVIALLAVVFALCDAAGISPLHAVTMDATFSQWPALVMRAATALRGAAPVWQILFGVLFLAVNAALVLLLRRPTRGIDA